ncbi:MAG: hypothetical protein PVF83_06555 [Anaerolineales bacterium]
MGRGGHVEQSLRNRPKHAPVDLLRQALGHLVPDPDLGGDVVFAVLFGHEVLAEQRPHVPPVPDRHAVVLRLHKQQDDGAFGPSGEEHAADEIQRSAEDAPGHLDEAADPSLFFVKQRPGQNPGEAAFGGEVEGFDVGDLVGLEDRTDGHALRVIDVEFLRDCAGHGFAVRPHDLSQAGGKVREGLGGIPAAEEEFEGAQHPGGEHHVAGAHPFMRSVQPVGRTPVNDLVSGAVGLSLRQWLDVPHHHLGQDLRSPFLGEIQVVLQEGVLGVVAAPDHAAPAEVAGVARRAFAVEIGVRVFLLLRPRLAEENAHVGRAESVPTAHLLGHLPDGLIAGVEPGVLGDPQHTLGSVVVWAQGGLPIGQVFPGGGFEELLVGFDQDVAVGEAAAAHACPTVNERAAQEIHFEDAETAQGRAPQVFPQVPVRFGVVFVPVAFPPLEHQHFVSFFRQTHGGDAPPES